MAIPLMEDDVEIISKLGDVPGSDDGLSTQQLKNKFDAAAILIKNYINNVLIPKIENAVDESALLSQIGKALSSKLSLTGGKMLGSIDMGGNRIKGLPMPEADDHAVSKIFADSAYDARPIRVENLIVQPTGFTQLKPENLEEVKLVEHGYIYRAAVPVSGAMADMFPYVNLSLMDVEDSGSLIANQFCCYDGGFYLYANSIPNTAITVLTAELRRTYACVPLPAPTDIPTLLLNNDGTAVAQVVIDGVTYGISNASVEANEGKYDFTVL